MQALCFLSTSIAWLNIGLIICSQCKVLLNERWCQVWELQNACFAVSVMVQYLPAVNIIIMYLLFHLMEFYNIFVVFVMLFRKTRSRLVVFALVGWPVLSIWPLELSHHCIVARGLDNQRILWSPTRLVIRYPSLPTHYYRGWEMICYCLAIVASHSLCS